MFFQLIIFICFYFSIITTSELLSKENKIAESIIDFGAKTCTLAFECWSTEPVIEDGRPLFMPYIAKRLEIGGGLHNKSGKGKCRCKEGRCMFYSLPERIFYECQEI
ncbi:unnamed protein product [Meloidogyne enterolobii]|uniref:Uncharacterized protein n=1 Tax=Meloidogyne enterolobii TaxID=390850 RepID=A0ACB0ZGQ8_MELEN